MKKIHAEMIAIAKRQFALKNKISIDEIKDEVEEDFAREASAFANKGQNELPDEYDPSDDDNDAISDSDKILEDPEEDNIEILEKLFLRTKNKSNRYSQLKIWSKFLQKIQINAPDLYCVLEFILVVPNGTSEVEGFFKVLKEMKSKRRNNINSAKLRMLLKIYFFLEDNPNKELLYQFFVEDYRKNNQRR